MSRLWRTDRRTNERRKVENRAVFCWTRNRINWDFLKWKICFFLWRQYLWMERYLLPSLTTGGGKGSGMSDFKFSFFLASVLSSLSSLSEDDDSLLSTTGSSPFRYFLSSSFFWYCWSSLFFSPFTSGPWKSTSFSLPMAKIATYFFPKLS